MPKHKKAPEAETECLLGFCSGRCLCDDGWPDQEPTEAELQQAETDLGKEPFLEIYEPDES